MNKQQTSIVILAAGKGTRMKSNIPKVLHKICGKEMLYYIVRESLKLSDDVSVVLGFQAEQIKNAMKQYFGDTINFISQDLENYPGTGGALMQYKPKNKKVLVLNGDMPLVNDKEIQKLILQDSQITMSVIDKKNTNGYGRVVIKDNEVLKIVEEKDASDEILSLSTLNAGVYSFDSEILKKYIPLLKNNNKQNEYYLTDVIALAKNDNISIRPIFVDIESFKGVNDKEDLAKAEQIMCNIIKSKWLKNGVTMKLVDTIYIEDDVIFEGECTIESCVGIYGKSKIINSHIKQNTIVESSTIENSDIGPLAHIRPESNINNTHIGNFVEIKKSNLNGIKAGHLSYIGDSNINEGTNIGAGFITCNYDGKSKHKTIIGKNVFVGSDVQIIAPITIDNNSIIGAGSTVRSNVKEGELYLTKGEEIRKEGFFYKFFSKK